ncbi:MAG: DUF721 domain-containing protein, partial [Hyphomicrobiaceae bacterium]
MKRKTSRASTSAGAAAKTRKASSVPTFGARAVGAFLPNVTDKVFEKHPFSDAALLTEWPAIVGTDLAGYTTPERLTRPRKKKTATSAEAGGQDRPGTTLTLRVESARVLDVHYRGEQIIERINGYFGYRAVTVLK